MTLYTNDTIIAISPVPALATGPVHSSCDMQTTISPIEVTNVNTAA